MSNVDLQRFCATDDVLDLITEPFRLDDHLIATNRAIAVRAPSVGGQAETIPERLMDAFRATFREEVDPHTWQPLPELPTRVECDKCSGSGRVSSFKCGDCDGNGTFERSGHEYECMECDGDGVIREDSVCANCHGMGEALAKIVIGPAEFDARLLRLIADLPGLKISVTSEAAAATFEFDGGDGKVMPMNKGRS